MSTIEIKKFETYNYDELSLEAQEKAFEKWQEGQTEWFWADVAIASMKEFAKHFDVTVESYKVGGYGRNFIVFTLRDDAISELSYIRLWKYLQNNGYVDKGVLEGQCPFTGYCADEILLDEIRDFIKKPYDITFYDLIDKCFDKWVKDCNADVEYQVSEEYFLEYDAQENKYLKDGTVFYG